MEFKTCGNCFVHLPINLFGKKRNLEIYKHCGNCRLIKKRSYSKGHPTPQKRHEIDT